MSSTICRDRALKTPSGLGEVQQGLGVSSSDYGPLSVLRSACRPKQGHQSDYYIIILPLFGFQRGYGMTERSNFILTEINGYYNSNDRWKFILFFD